MVPTSSVKKIGEGSPNILELIDSGKVSYVISTSEKGANPAEDSVKMRRRTVERAIACLTAIDTAAALTGCLRTGKTMADVELIDITRIWVGP